MPSLPYKGGDHKVQCDRCGVQYYRAQTQKEWTGALVCRGPGTFECWEPRHPVDYVRTKPENVTVRDARPRITIDVADVFPNGVSY